MNTPLSYAPAVRGEKGRVGQQSGYCELVGMVECTRGNLFSNPSISTNALGMLQPALLSWP